MPDRMAAQIRDMKINGDVTTLSRWHAMENMTCLQAAILLLAQDNPGCTTGAIAKVLKSSKPSVSRAAIKLLRLGMMTSEIDPADRRLVKLYVVDGWENKL